MLRYFFGDDTFGARQAIGELAHKQGSRIRWVDRDDLFERSVSDWLSQANGLFGSELVVFRDVVTWPKVLQEQFLEVEGSGVVWDREKPDKRNKLFKAFQKGESREFSLLSQAQLIDWLGGENVDSSTASLLVSWIGNDRWKLKSIVEYLRLVSESGQITRELIEAHVSPAEVMPDIFPTIEAVAARNAKQALHSISALLRNGESEFYILSMLGYQFKTMVTVRQGLDRGWGASDIVRERNMKLFPVQKTMPLVRDLSLATLQDVLARILATDFAIKQGKVEARVGLMMLVLAISRR